jgi:hypothetical protein
MGVFVSSWLSMEQDDLWMPYQVHP